MSRIGRMPITVPSGVTVNINQNTVSVKGPKGELKRTFNQDMKLTLEDGRLEVARPSDNKEHRAVHGLTRSLLASMVEGVTKGFEKSLEIVGVGFRADKDGDNIILRVGFTHTVNIKPRPGITLDVDAKNVNIKVSGIDKEVVGQMAAEIRRIRPPDAYKGKGVRYAGEVVKLKPGKAGKAVGGGKGK
ncbi:MAG: 50S ribosomal protein L6 [Dehalococcoidia bacterium]|nr:50S ribosomal protein L6 [Dehalococcoidia bacterium]